MMRKQVKACQIEIADHRYRVRYYETWTARGTRRFSCEVILDKRERIILDGDSMTILESRVDRLAPAMIYSRLLARRTGVAA
jgi:hypothetical protein